MCLKIYINSSHLKIIENKSKSVFVHCYFNGKKVG